MENSLVSRHHLSEKMREDLIYGRLSALKVAVIEEHLRVCAPCRSELEAEKEYILGFRVAAAQPQRARRFPGGRRGVIAAAGVLAAAWIAALTSPPHPGSPETIALASYRGAAGSLVNHAAAGHPLDLSISAADVPPAAKYRLEVVSFAGASIWSGAADFALGKIGAHVTRPLPAGMYWVRLYAHPSELLAEYGLVVK